MKLLDWLKDQFGLVVVIAAVVYFFVTKQDIQSSIAEARESSTRAATEIRTELLVAIGELKLIAERQDSRMSTMENHLTKEGPIWEEVKKDWIIREAERIRARGR